MTQTRKKIDVMVPNFDDFGAQRLAINLANGFAAEFDVTFVVFDDDGPFKFYLNEDIKLLRLDYGWSNIKKIRLLPRFFRYLKYTKQNKTDVAITFAPVANMVILFAKFFNPRLKTIVQEHCFPSLAVKDRQNMSFFIEWLFRLVVFPLYNFSSIFVCIAKAGQRDFVDNFGIKEIITKVVHNPNDIHGLLQMADEPITDFDFKNDKQYLIGIGRLVDQKNFYKLVRIFNEVKKELPNTELLILGNGLDKAGLEALADELNISQAVHLLGFKKNPYNYLRRADCFCLTSNWEGFPGVVAESMICGTVVVANDCPSGPNEMLINGETGRLIPIDSERLFVEAVKDVLQNREERKQLESNALDYAKHHYAMSTYLDIYREMINSITA